MKRQFEWFLCVAILACLAMSLCAGGTSLADGYAEVVPPRYDQAHDFHEGLAMVRLGDFKTGKCGYIDKAGNEVISPKYIYADDFQNGLAVVELGSYRTSTYGVIDTEGNEVLPCEYDFLSIVQEGLLLVTEDGLYGFLDMEENEVTPCKYYIVYDFYDGLALVGVETEEETCLWGFVDTTGREVIPCVYDWVGKEVPAWQMYENKNAFSEGLIAAGLPGDGDGDEGSLSKWGIIDRTGEMVVPFELTYDLAGQFHEGLMAVMEIDEAAYAEAGGVIGETDDDEDEDDFSASNYARVGFIDATGELVIPLSFTCPFFAGNHCIGEEYRMPQFSEGLAAVMNDERQEPQYGMQNNGKFGYIDKAGNVIIPFIYDYAAPFSEGLAYVGQGERFGFIDTDGEVVIPLTYAYDKDFGCDDGVGYISPRFFSDGVAMVPKVNPEGGLRYGLIDRDNNVIVPFEAEWFYVEDGLAELFADYVRDERNIPTTLYDLETDTLVSMDKYLNVLDFSEGYAAVAVGGSWASLKWGFIDRTGREVVPCVYDDVGSFSEGLAAFKRGDKWGFLTITE